MIDIRKLDEVTFDITLTDGRVLNIKKPNRELFDATFKMVDILQANDENDKVFDIIYSFLAKIFNRNKNDIKLTQKDLEKELDVVNAIYIIKEFQKFITEAMQGVNF